MRGPIAVGVLAAVLVVLVAAAAFVALALGRPGPSFGTPPPVAVPASPARTPSPLPIVTPGASQPPIPSAVGTASPGVSEDPGPSASLAVGLAVGDLAPPLALPQLGGAEIDTALLAGQPLWVNFMATWCPPCRDELPVMERMQAQLGGRMTILLIDVGEDEQTVATFMTSLGIDLPVGLDTSSAAQRAWGAYALPVHYWIDADGRIGGFLYGGAGPEQFIEGVHSVLPDASLEP